MTLFVSLEGWDPSARAVQGKLLVEYLQRRGISCTTPQALGRHGVEGRLDHLVRDDSTDMPVVTRALLESALWSQEVQSIIRPALRDGTAVIYDGFVDGSLVRFGYVGGLPLDFLLPVYEMATGALRPHRTVLLDSPAPAEGNLQAMRDGYLQLMKSEPRRIKRVDAVGSVYAIQTRICQLIDELLPRYWG